MMAPMPGRLVVGVVGHVDHGKTALVRALTGIETDRLPEERRRGISIALGFAHLVVPGAVVDLIDMPGHERFVRTLVSGATGVDAVLVVVAANEGVKPQTVEHVDVAALLGVGRAVVVVTKADLVEAGRVSEVAAAAIAVCVGRGIEARAVAVVGGLDTAGGAWGLEDVRAAMAGLAVGAMAARDVGAPFLPIDRAFSVAGHGTVVTGTLRGGGLAVGDAVALVPGGSEARVRGLQVHGGRVAAVGPGQRVAVNLRGVEVAAVRPGAALAGPGMLAGSVWLSLQVRATAGAPALPTTARVRLLVGTQEVEARLRLLDRDVLQPGQQALAQVQCAEAVAVPAREHVILRLASPASTVAGGRVLDNAAVRLRRRDAGVLARLASLAGAAPEDVVGMEVEAAGVGGTTLARLGSLAGLGAAAVAGVLEGHGAVVLRNGLVVARMALAVVEARVLELVGAEAGPAGQVTAARVAAAVPGVGEWVLQEALRRLAAAGTVRLEGGGVAPVRREAEFRQADAASALEGRLAAALLRGGLAPPDDAALVRDVAARRAVAALVRAGVVVRAADRVQKRDVLFHRDAVAAAQVVLTPLLVGAGVTVSEVGAALGISRKFSVPLLEHLDAVQFTRRVGDRRVSGARQACGLHRGS